MAKERVGKGYRYLIRAMRVGMEDGRRISWGWTTGLSKGRRRGERGCRSWGRGIAGG